MISLVMRQAVRLNATASLGYHNRTMMSGHVHSNIFENDVFPV